MKIPFNKPFLTGQEIEYIQDAHSKGQLAGDGFYTKMCNSWLKENISCAESLLTHSCTAALEMAALLINAGPGDEIIMPSYTFVSTANAFVLRGATPVFVDIRPDTLNIDEKLIERAITTKTKAIIPVHYAGVGCEMSKIRDLASERNLFVIEDAAQGIMSSYEGAPLGSIGDLGCLSFHETKNIIAGEGGALLINNPLLKERAEIILEKGTDRKKYFRGQVDKYTWVDVGSSYLPGEIVAAFLWAQMQKAEEITLKRVQAWEKYHQSFAQLEANGLVRRPYIPNGCSNNAHMYYLILNSLEKRTKFIEELARVSIGAVFHYVPLHESPMGKSYAGIHPLKISSEISNTLVRLPMWVGIDSFQDEIIEKVLKVINKIH